MMRLHSHVRLIDVDGEQVGIVPIEQALMQAEASGLDLVLISPNADNPCRIMTMEIPVRTV